MLRSRTFFLPCFGRLILNGVCALALVFAGCDRTTHSIDEDVTQTKQEISDRRNAIESVPITEPIHSTPLVQPTLSTKSSFQLLSADQTGVDFIHQWNPTPRHELKLANAVAGGGVAVGNYDGDNRPDLWDAFYL